MVLMPLPLPRGSLPSAAEAPAADCGKRRKVSGLHVAVVGGAGHVGLPLSLVLASRGHHVVAIDSDAARLAALRRGEFPFAEAGGPELLRRCLAEIPERIAFTSEHADLCSCDVIVLTVGTPVDEHLNPRFTVVEASIRKLQPFMRKGQTLILRATVFPGTTTRILTLLQEAGLDVGASFCPDRLASGHAVEELTELPQIVSGSDAAALAHAEALFAPLGVDLVELEVQEAEVAKLFINAWRYVIFGTANQFYHIATSRGLDFHRIREAIMHRYKRAAGFPRPGFTAGPQLFKDTMQLAAFCRHSFSLGHAAMLVNETMPDCLLEQAKRELAQSGRTLAGARCGILGMAFKPNSDDFRESLAFKLRRLLLWEDAEVLCSDTYIRHEGFIDADALVARSELIFIGCPHPEYCSLAFRAEQKVFDCGSLMAQPAAAMSNGPPGEHNVALVGVTTGEDTRRGTSALSVAVIGGAGHAGLPLSLVLADYGHHVVVVDSDSAKLEAIRRGHFPFLEAGGPELLARCLAEFPGRLQLTTDYAAVRRCEIIVVTIGTPVDEHLNPCFSLVESCVRELMRHLHSGQTLLLRSTLFPGTSARVSRMLRAGGLAGVGVSFCPERIAQGHAVRELAELPQIVSGSDAQALAQARALFASLGVDLVELELQEAEAAKLFLNAWRYVVFATANQFYHIASSKGLDFDKIRAAITHKYQRAAGFPRAGFTAGPCLFKDTMQLAAYCRHTFSLGHAAMLVNETMPDCLLEQARREVAQHGRTLAGAKCGILGMAFKPDNDDCRESLAFKLRRLLQWEGASVVCSDVHMRCEGFVDAARLVAQSELIFLGCPHDEYRGLAFGPGTRVFDCWGFAVQPALRITRGSKRL